MSEPQLDPLSSSRIHQLSKDFRRLGWIGFCLQAILGFIPFLILIFVLFLQPSLTPETQGTSFFGAILSYSCLLALIFTTYWCFHYTQVSRKLEDPQRRPQKTAVLRCLWIGLTANIIGMICAVIVGMGQIGTFLFKTLLLPSGATTIYRPIPGAAVLNPGSILAPFDLISLQAIMNAIAADLVGIIITSLLLFRVMKPQSKA
ncbi:MAG: DUF3611 family protein [Cyanobacteria bacterium J06592_8]